MIEFRDLSSLLIIGDRESKILGGCGGFVQYVMHMKTL